MEEEIGSLYKVIDDANLTKAELEEQMENMRAELRILEHNHEQVPPNSVLKTHDLTRSSLRHPHPNTCRTNRLFSGCGDSTTPTWIGCCACHHSAQCPLRMKHGF